MAGTLQTRRLAPLALLAAALVCVFALAPEPAEPAAAAKKCPKAHAATSDANSKQLGKAVLCLIGKERRSADKKQLDSVASLTRVARKHTDVMIETDCLDHRCKGEKPLQERIVNSGYPIAGGRYGFGEVTGCSLTPKAMVEAWMESGVHRKRLLGKKYRDVGIGAGKGKPDVPGCDDGPRRGVYTVIFGWRKR
jgi:uncharacterized protein YkwD